MFLGGDIAAGTASAILIMRGLAIEGMEDEVRVVVLEEEGIMPGVGLEVFGPGVSALAVCTLREALVTGAAMLLRLGRSREEVGSMPGGGVEVVGPGGRVVTVCISREALVDMAEVFNLGEVVMDLLSHTPA